jgi:glycosyl hydrolase family 2/Ig-like domain-containing protein/concanavalin A-like lectin/glucanase superfamily protein
MRPRGTREQACRAARVEPHWRERPGRKLVAVLTAILALIVEPAATGVTGQALASTANFGPYNLTVLKGGVGLTEPLAPDSPVIEAGATWSLSGWLRVERLDGGRSGATARGATAAGKGDARMQRPGMDGSIASHDRARRALADESNHLGSSHGGRIVIAALGDPAAPDCRCLVLDQGTLTLHVGATSDLRANAPIDGGSWHAVAATHDGHVARLYLDGVEVASGEAATEKVAAALSLAPVAPGELTGEHHFAGSLALFQLHDKVLDTAQIEQLSAARPDFALVPFHRLGVGWPWQERQWRGLQEPQPASTLPHANAPPSPPTRDLAATATPPLRAYGDNRWVIGAWHMMPAPAPPTASGETISSPDYRENNWYPAVVPGTALTTLIANGVYPDPDYGLNNLAIPESLSRQDYWYRTSFMAPPELEGKRLTLTFNGINYDATVWLNGIRLGQIRGAFVRGNFDISRIARPGSANVLAVRVSPPPHPGIPHEQSVAAGPGRNGGSLAIDGPTFIATEGWDWIPGVRDRNTGLWQDVELSSSGDIRILDPQIVSSLPLPRTDSAELTLHVPVENQGTNPTSARVEAHIGTIHVSKDVTLPLGETEIVLAAKEFPQLRLANPRLWWPNGYGKQDLYTAQLSVAIAGHRSDSRAVRFGIRQITYELSLFDHEGRLRRVEVDPTAGSARHERLVDVSHEAIKRTANGWAASLTAAGESSPAVHDIDSSSLTPYLAIRVNGVRIAARGGSWGMDDLLKRVGREHLEPYFRLHHNAHLNIIRNWLGQNTEEVFYDLADEYGLLLLNDFWESTQNTQVEAEDPQLFLDNALDVIRRFRNHPSIAVWFGRNEGVPQPILNQGLAEAVATLDGTRYYTGSSNTVNLQGSGPYNWRPPEGYFTTLAQGFSVEVGTPSLASAESLRASIPAADLWPAGDTYAYHDWHFGGNGDNASFLKALQTRFRAATSFADFERKAQLMNYVSHRAIFEGFQAHLWTQNSGRLLWMTHPSWPSNSWQIYTSDYDTPAAYYAVAKACEPVHAQLDLPDFRVTVVNTTREPKPALRLRSRVVSLENRVLLERVDKVDAPADDIVTLAPLELKRVMEKERVVLVELTLTDANGTQFSSNTYWQSAADEDLARLSDLPNQPLELSANAVHAQGQAPRSPEGSIVRITLQNRGRTPALLAKVTLLNAAGQRVLPAYYSDNYVTLLPGESRDIEAICPAEGSECTRVSVAGWNVAPATVDLR